MVRADVSVWHEMYCHDLEVITSIPGQIKLGVRSTSVLSRKMNLPKVHWQNLTASTICAESVFQYTVTRKDSHFSLSNIFTSVLECEFSAIFMHAHVSHIYSWLATRWHYTRLILLILCLCGACASREVFVQCNICSNNSVVRAQFSLQGLF